MKTMKTQTTESNTENISRHKSGNWVTKENPKLKLEIYETHWNQAIENYTDHSTQLNSKTPKLKIRLTMSLFTEELSVCLTRSFIHY